MKKILSSFILFYSTFSWAAGPIRYTELLDYVQPGPDQGKTGTCLYVGSTGAMELLANKSHGIKNPMAYGEFDLSEPYLIHADPYPTEGKTFFEKPIYKFNHGFGVHITDWPLVVWHNGQINRSAWSRQDYWKMPRILLPQVETINLFSSSNKWAKNVLNKEHINKMKEAMVKYRAPLLVNYNDNKYWHVILVVGFDDRIEGECYQTELEKCSQTKGSFYVRDSFGKIIEVRDYDWFISKGNSAFVVKLKDDIFDANEAE